MYACVYVCICVFVCDTAYDRVRAFVLISFPAFTRVSVRACTHSVFLTAVLRDVSTNCPSAVSDRPLGSVTRPGDGPRGTHQRRLGAGATER